MFRDTVDALLELEPHTSVTLLTSYHNHDRFGAWERRVRLVYIPEEQRHARIAKETLEHDVLWCPFQLLEPEDPGIPAVVSIPDLQHVHHPELFSREMLALRLRGFRIATGRARRVLTPSGFSKRCLVESYGLPEEQVVVVPHGCPVGFHDPPSEARQSELRRRYDLPEIFGLYPANNWAHKNHRGLFRSMAVYGERWGGIDVILVGSIVPGGIDLRAEIEGAGVTGRVRHIGRVDQADMPHLYDCASFLVYPSLFEGFGIPVLEGMARGTPVVAADRAALPGLVGDCGAMVDPADPDALALAMREAVARTDAVAQRLERGRQRAREYSYEHIAALTSSVLRRAMRVAAPAVLRGRAPRVFIVTPSLNQGRFLREAIESVLSQDHPVDYFVADGGSTDESVAVLESFGNRLRWVSGPDGGQSAAIAEAWRRSDAEIVAWLNSDDTLFPGAVSAAVDFLAEHPEAAMVYGKAWYTGVDGRFTEPYPTREFDPELLARECFICQPAAFVRREVFQVVDLPDPGLRYCMDYDLWIRMSRHFEIAHLDRFLATSRVHPGTKTLSERELVYRETMEVVRRHFGGVPRTWKAGYISFRAKRILDRHRWMIPRSVQRRLYDFAMRRKQLYAPVAPFADGWVGRRTVHHVRLGEDGWVTLSASSPHWPLRKPLAVKVVFEGKTLATAVVEGRGPFEIRVQVPGRRLVPVALELVANGSFVPRRHGFGDDGRSVAFRVRSIQADGPARRSDLRSAVGRPTR